MADPAALDSDKLPLGNRLNLAPHQVEILATEVYSSHWAGHLPQEKPFGCFGSLLELVGMKEDSRPSPASC